MSTAARRVCIGLAFAATLTGCSATRTVIDMISVTCPPEAVDMEQCAKPPESGTERSQADIFTNELGCWLTAENWRKTWESCKEKGGS